MISDTKKEEVRAAADIVEVVSDYVKLKRSGSGFIGLCPYHSENTPSFHVTPSMGIFKCFGCGESGDVFKFVMDQEGIGFTEAIRQIASRYGVIIPDEEFTQEQGESYQLKEGIYHALKYAGVFFHMNLRENPEAEKAIEYLNKRGYKLDIMKRFGLGYAPAGGSELYRSAMNAGIDERYLIEADLIKAGNRGNDYYDTFRGRLMFPIFSPSKRLIAFAGRVLGNEKTAKYINSAQTKVYNKSEVVFGVNYAMNDIRKNKEVILVEGYTDVITLNEHGIKNVVASSGTALTPGQMKILHRYGEKIVMIYDSDSAGQNAMKRGIHIALAEGMEVQLLELPKGEDPDSFVKQFGRESFIDLKNQESKNFVDFLMLKAEEEGRLDRPAEQARLITEILEAIASIPEDIQRQVFVQHLHQRSQRFRRGSDRELFEDLERIMARKKREIDRDRFRAKRQAPISDASAIVESQITEDENRESPNNYRDDFSLTKKPHYEKELIRLMIVYKRDMVEYICSFTNERMFEDPELAKFFRDIVERFKKQEPISIEVYTGKSDPFPRLLGDILLQQHSASERVFERTGQDLKQDKFPFKIAKSAIKAIQISFFDRMMDELAEKLSTTTGEEKRLAYQARQEIQAKYNELMTHDADDFFPDPKHLSTENGGKKNVFEYKMKGSD